MSFLDLAGDDSDVATAPPPKKSFLELAEYGPKKAAKQSQSSSVAPGGPFMGLPPDQQAAILDDMQKNGVKFATFNGNPIADTPAGGGRGSINPPLASQPQPVPVSVAPTTVLHGFAAIPREDGSPTAPASPEKWQDQWRSENWWDKARGAAEAGAGTIASIPAGVIGAFSHPDDPQAAAETTGRIVNNFNRLFVTPGQDISPTGARYLGNVGDTIQASGVPDALTALGPVGDYAHVLANVGDAAKFSKGWTAGAVDKSFAGMQSAFEARKAAARIEPTMGAQAPGAAPQGATAAALSAATRGAPASPGASYRPSIADATPDLQQFVANAKAKGIPLNADILDRHLEAQTLPIPIRLTEGQATQNPTILSNEANSRGAQPALADAYNQQGKQLVQNADAIRDAAAPDVTATNHVENGQTLVDSYKAKDAAAQAEITARYKALADANGGALPLDGKAFAKAADSALAKNLKSNHIPPGIAADLQSFREGAPMTFEDFESLRSNLAAEARGNANGNQVAASNIIRNTLEQMPMTNETAAIKPLADAARSAAKARFAAIEADPAYKAVINDSTGHGDPSPLADNFINNYVVKGKGANVSTMRQNLADDPLASQTIAAGTINYLKAKAGADPVTGTFSQAGYNRALAEVAPKLDSLFDPKTAQQVQALGNVAKYTQTQPRGSFVNNSNTFTASLASKAVSGLEKAGNAVAPFFNLGTETREALARRAANHAVERALSPGAGSTRVSDFPR